MLRYALLILGITGSILFFPFNFGNSHTCLAHKYIKSDASICCENPPGNEQPGHSTEVEINSGENHHLLSHYLYPFAFLWWISIGIVFLSYKYFKGIGSVKKKIKKDITGEKII